MSDQSKMRASLERIKNFSSKHFKSPSTTDSLLSSQEMTFGASLYKAGVIPSSRFYPCVSANISPTKHREKYRHESDFASKTYQSPGLISKHRKTVSDVKKLPQYCDHQVFEENTMLYHTLIKNSAKRKKELSKLINSESPQSPCKQYKKSFYNPAKNLTLVFDEFQRRK